MGGGKAVKKQEMIVIDEAKGLQFHSEDELYQHFCTEISTLEKDFFSTRPKDDIEEKEFDKYEQNLNVLLENPDEIWVDKETL